LLAADVQPNSQKLPCRIRAEVIVIVNAGFAERFRERAAPDFVKGDPASPDFVTRLRRIS
jgi:hypothetical protein